MGVSVPSESDHDHVLAAWVGVGDREGDVPGLNGRYDFVFAANVEVSWMSRSIRCYQCPCVGDVSDFRGCKALDLVASFARLSDAGDFKAVRD